MAVLVTVTDIPLRNALDALPRFCAALGGETDHATDGQSVYVTLDNGLCQLSASKQFLTIALSGSDDDHLDALRRLVEGHITSLVPDCNIGIGWR